MPETAVDFGILEQVETGVEILARFSDEATGEMKYLLALHGRGIVELERQQYVDLEWVMNNRAWRGDISRVQCLIAGERWNFHEFVGAIGEIIEWIDIK